MDVVSAWICPYIQYDFEGEDINYNAFTYAEKFELFKSMMTEGKGRTYHINGDTLEWLNDDAEYMADECIRRLFKDSRTIDERTAICAMGIEFLYEDFPIIDDMIETGYVYAAFKDVTVTQENYMGLHRLYVRWLGGPKMYHAFLHKLYQMCIDNSWKMPEFNEYWEYILYCLITDYECNVSYKMGEIIEILEQGWWSQNAPILVTYSEFHDALIECISSSYGYDKAERRALLLEYALHYGCGDFIARFSELK